MLASSLCIFLLPFNNGETPANPASIYCHLTHVSGFCAVHPHLPADRLQRHVQCLCVSVLRPHSFHSKPRFPEVLWGAPPSQLGGIISDILQYISIHLSICILSWYPCHPGGYFKNVCALKFIPYMRCTVI